MITIKSISIVVPSEPTPNGPLQLSESDQIMPWTHPTFIYIYRSNNNIPLSFETMNNSLSRALAHFYPLAGRLKWIEGGRLQVDCNAIGVQVLEAHSDLKLDELGDFAPTGTVEDLVPKIDYTTPIEEWPLLRVQLTRFVCGGLSVGVAISHTLVDGLSTTNFINSWAKLARGDNLDDHEIPFLDRTVLRSKQVEGLKKRANQEMGVTIRPYTRYEAISGHIWRCACKVRAIDNSHDQQTRVRLVVDARKRLKPPLPQRYFGNAIFGTVTSTCLYGDLLSNPLSYSVGKLREAIERMTDEYIRSAIDFITSQKHVGGLRSSFHIQGYTQGPFLGNPNLSLTSWINLPIYDADFGWGKPVYVGPGSLNMDGKAFLMSSVAVDGSLIIALRLQAQYMDSFKKIFYEDID
uniref:Uncharacterized protein n=1 Tax=Fagus sylvatica TaxID=28930 RepID=A0A2N9FUP4_FAGSY